MAVNRGPFRKVVDRVERRVSTIFDKVAGTRTETLECGHKICMKMSVAPATRRRCSVCGDLKRMGRG